jgi:hypothetical protein
MWRPILLLSALVGFHPAPGPESLFDRTAETGRIAEVTGPPLGKYACYVLSYHPHRPPGQGFTITPSGLGFILLPNGKYKPTDQQKDAGEYSYELNSAEISWTSGAFVEFKPEYTFKYVGLNSSGHTILLLRDGKRQQNCVTKKDASD